MPAPPARIGCSRDRHRAIGRSRGRGGAWLLLRGGGAAGDTARGREAATRAMAAPSPGHREVLASSPEAGSRAAAAGSSCRGLLWHLQDKRLRLGLFDIDPGHKLHQMTCMMQAGLWAATQVSMDHPPTQGFELGTLAGPAFARLRRSLGLADEDYQAALGPGGPYLQFLSTSKSKASFFLSHDQRFFLKTQRRREVQVLLAHLPRYVQHLQRHPHSLLARLLGVHSLRVAQGKKVGKAEARGLGRRGRLEGEILPHSLPTPVPRNTSSSCRASSFPPAASPRGESASQGPGPTRNVPLKPPRSLDGRRNQGPGRRRDVPKIPRWIGDRGTPDQHL
uniref:PIPK domain-containing protein n=1 Tax=Equus asinus asinus TaxID=83772 RepID=A0A8C4N039_EQUAS